MQRCPSINKFVILGIVGMCPNNETCLFFPCGNSCLQWHACPCPQMAWFPTPFPTIVSALLQSRLLSALLPHPLPSPFSASFPFQPMIIDPEKEREKWKTAAADAIYGYCKLRAKAPRRSTNSTVVQSPSPHLLHTM